MKFQICVLAALLALCQAASAQDAAARAATIKQVQGEVTVVSGDQKRPGLPGDAVRESDRIATGDGGAASLILRDGTVLAVGPRSAVDLTRFRFDGTTQEGDLGLRLVQGSFRMITGLIAKLRAPNVVIVTRTLTLGVRGTDFIVEEE